MTSDSFVRIGTSKSPNGDDCRGIAGCQEVTIPAGDSGTVLGGQWVHEQGTIRVAVQGTEIVRWTLKGSREGFPETIEYQETALNGGVVATARYALKDVLSVPGNLARENQIPASGPVTVLKDRQGFGPYRQESGDPWQFHATEKAKWDRFEGPGIPNSSANPFPLLIAGLLVLLVSGIATWWLLTAKAKPPRPR